MMIEEPQPDTPQKDGKSSERESHVERSVTKFPFRNPKLIQIDNQDTFADIGNFYDTEIGKFIQDPEIRDHLHHTFFEGNGIPWGWTICIRNQNSHDEDDQ